MKAQPDELKSAQHPLVLFDGVCGLCDRSVSFIIDHDPQAIFRFAPVQSPLGQSMLARESLDNAPGEPGSVILVEGETIYRRSTALVRILGRLSGLTPLAARLAITLVPPPLRDALYNRVARNRYRWFGKRDTCRMPTAATAERFLG
jgi:predicted DCC family thiol-disulfide oxidoreductase YuxK